MATFIITAHIEFPSKTQPIQTGVIRMEIPAENEAEAREKAQAFIGRKLSVVVDGCENKADAKAKELAADLLKKFGGAGVDSPQGFKDAFMKGFGGASHE